MSKSRLFVLAVGLALVIGVIVLILALSSRRHTEFHARSRLKLDPNGPIFAPFFFQDELQAMSNLLSGAENHLTLAKVSAVNETCFALELVRPIRNTKFVELVYRGANPNAAQSLASNAANRIISYYATNQPGWGVTFVDAEVLIPPTPWEKLQDSAESCSNRFKYSSW